VGRFVENGGASAGLEPVDVAVVGSGIAGLFLAVRCARSGMRVAVVTKKGVSTSSTNWAQGGIAGVLDVDDNEAIEAHVMDTIEAGAGLCDETVVRSVIKEAAMRIKDLVEHGVRFDRGDDGAFHMAMEGGHSGARILHSRDRTGREIERALTEVASSESDSDFRIMEDWMAVDLIQHSHGSPGDGVSGIWCLNPEGEVWTLPAKVVVLATGGSGMMHKATTNPSIATGDGVAMAHRAGAEIRDMEFIQFHPTSLSVSSQKPFLISEAMRGHGAVLMTIGEYDEWRGSGSNHDPNEYSFMRRYSNLGSLGTRDIVARAIDHELKKSGDPHALLITEHLGKEGLQEGFPTICARLEEFGIELGVDPIPIIPAAHYMVGGVRVDSMGRAIVDGSPMPGLFAIGEVACTGLHGANRLASNSLLEAVVFSERAAGRIIEEWKGGNLRKVPKVLPGWRSDDLDTLVEHSPLRTDLEALRATMTQDVGIVKSDSRLERAERRLDHIEKEVTRAWKRCKPTQDLVELRNLVMVSKMVVSASKNRRKNVGLHYNLDLS
tara:strand:+ start:136 stop:1785 length:1650 start_codon:yes stop_codon:yes gene_type:complete